MKQSFQKFGDYINATVEAFEKQTSVLEGGPEFALFSNKSLIGTTTDFEDDMTQVMIGQAFSQK